MQSATSSPTHISCSQLPGVSQKASEAQRAPRRKQGRGKDISKRLPSCGAARRLLGRSRLRRPCLVSDSDWAGARTSQPFGSQDTQ